MTTERIQILILGILADAPRQLFTARQLHSDLNGQSPEAVSQTETARALDALERAVPAQIIRVEGSEVSQGLLVRILPAGLMRALAAPKND